LLAQTQQGSGYVPLVAKYRVAVISGAGTGSGVVRQQEWIFVREVDRIAINKGGTEEIWHRGTHGTITLQRVLHAQQRVVDYSAGELAALGVDVNWSELSRFASQSRPAGVEWDDKQQLPVQILQAWGERKVVRFDLLEWHATPPADWVLPGARGLNYVHLDAADFGDMGYDPAVKAAVALDVQAGWRQATHGH
jgi:hypothetical protein